MLRVGEIGRFRDDGGNAVLFAGVQPVTAAAPTIVAQDSGAGDSIVGHAFFKNGLVDHISHFPGQLAAAFIAVHGTFVVDHPVVGVAVVVQEYDTGRFLVKSVVHAEHADSHAARLVAGAVYAGDHGGVHLVHSGGSTGCSEFFVGRGGTAIADETGVSRPLDDSFGVDGVAIPEFTFLDAAAIAGIRGASPLSAALWVVVVADVQHDGAGLQRLSTEALLCAASGQQRKRCGRGENKQSKWVHNGNCVWPPGRLAPTLR